MSGRILIVDDDRDLVQTLAEALEVEGYEVLSAYDGSQCWDLIKRGKPDLLILDVMMPGKHGLQMAVELKRSDYGRIPVIMLTAVAEKLRDTTHSHDQALQCPADDLISKPVELEVLLQSIRKFI